MREPTLYETLSSLEYQPNIVRADGSIEAARSRSRVDESGIRYREARLEDARPFRWAWEQRILIDYLNLLVGEEGIGKGNLIAWMLAQITVGKLPGSLYGQRNNVAIVGDEDSFDHIWVPRLHVAGAKLRPNVIKIESGANGVLDVKEDAERLREFVKRRNIKVVYFDQLLDNLGYTDSWKDKQVRDALAPLQAVARETHIAVLAAMHPNKRGGSFRDRVSGTPAFNAVSRSSLLVVPHPYDEDRRVAVRPKGNYAAEPPGFEFRIVQTTIDIPPSRERRSPPPVVTSQIVEQQDGTISASDVLDVKADRRREDSQVGIARAALVALFADGKPRRVSDVQSELAPLGLPDRRISDAAREIGLNKRQEKGDYPAVWWWEPGP